MAQKKESMFKKAFRFKVDIHFGLSHLHFLQKVKITVPYSIYCIHGLYDQGTVLSW
jgi:hypothetical protein